MVPFGAPFVDVNHNGTYEPQIDTPGVRNAEQILFVCFTDANPQSHSIGEGFGGGTQPLGAEFHLTAWGYNKPIINYIQFLKWEIINKNTSAWDNTYFGIVCDPYILLPLDDYIGYDTTRNLGYCYNATNDLYNGKFQHAVGFDLLRGPINKYSNPQDSILMSAFSRFSCITCAPPPCETDPNGEPLGAYWFWKGFKKDGTPWYNHLTGLRTKYCYSGDSETAVGWTEHKGPLGIAMVIQ